MVDRFVISWYESGNDRIVTGRKLIDQWWSRRVIEYERIYSFFGKMEELEVARYCKMFVGVFGMMRQLG